MEVTAVGASTTIGRLTTLVARAQGSKPSVQRFADAVMALGDNLVCPQRGVRRLCTKDMLAMPLQQCGRSRGIRD